MGDGVEVLDLYLTKGLLHVMWQIRRLADIAPFPSLRPGPTLCTVNRL